MTRPSENLTPSAIARSIAEDRARREQTRDEKLAEVQGSKCHHPGCNAKFWFTSRYDREVGCYLLTCDNGHFHPGKISAGRERGESYERVPSFYGPYDCGSIIGE